MDKRESIIVWALGLLFALELFILLILVHFASFPVFLSIFVQTLRLLSPLFLWAYTSFLILIIFGKGKSLIAISWGDFLLELLRFFIVSFIIALFLLVISAILGALLVLLLKWIYSLPKTKGILEPLRKWVEATFY
jgi:hypothetical protein